MQSVILSKSVRIKETHRNSTKPSKSHKQNLSSNLKLKFEDQSVTPTPPEKPKRTVLLKADHVESFSNEYFSSESDEDEVPIITHIDKTTSISVKGSFTFRLIDNLM